MNDDAKRSKRNDSYSEDAQVQRNGSDEKSFLEGIRAEMDDEFHDLNGAATFIAPFETSSPRKLAEFGSKSDGMGARDPWLNADVADDPRFSSEETSPEKYGPSPGNVQHCLIVQDAHGLALAGRWFLDGSRLDVGRATENHIVIAHRSVSREHARFELREGRWWVRSLQPSTNPVLLRGAAVHDAEPLASTDLITIGVVVFQFVEPESVSLGETLPFPLAVALRQVGTAASSERCLKASVLGVELVFRFLFAAQVGALVAADRRGQIQGLLPRDLRPEQPISMGMWLRLVCGLAQGLQQDHSPLGMALNNLQQTYGGWGRLQQRIETLVGLRNDLMHRWFGEEDAFEAEARQASSELQTLARALVPLRALTLLGWLPADGSALAGGWPVRVLRGASAQFPVQPRNVRGPLLPYWCYLADDTGALLPLYPCFALATSQQTKRLDLFVNRSLFAPQAGGSLRMDGLTCGHQVDVPVPPDANPRLAGA